MPTYLRARNVLPLLGLDDLGEDRLLALGREGDLGVLAFHPVLEEAPLLHVVDVHVLEADVAAVIAPAGRRRSRARVASRSRACRRCRSADRGRRAEAVIVGRQVRRNVPPSEAERIQLGRKVAAHAIGADQHHRADALSAARRILVAGSLRQRPPGRPPTAGLSRSSPASDRGRGSVSSSSSMANSAVPSLGPVRVRS